MEEGVALLGTHSLIDDQVSKHSDSKRCGNVFLLHYPFLELSLAVTRIYIALSVCPNVTPFWEWLGQTPRLVQVPNLSYYY
jgi:hypothetical protein